MKRVKPFVCMCLCIVMFLSCPASAYAVTNASIQKKEQEVSEAKKEIESLKAGLTDLKNVKKQLEASKSDLTAYITELDAKLSEMQEKIADYENQITVKLEEIEVSKAELQAAEEVAQAQYDAMKKRIRFMYEKGDNLYMELLIEAGSFSDALNKADYVEMLSAYDRKKLDEYTETIAYVQACKEQLEAEEEVLEEVKKALEEEEANVQELIAEKEEEVAKVSANIAEQEAAIGEFQEEINAQNAEIAALEKAIAAERAALEEANRRKYNGGVFAWPCPSYTRISDEYGNRINPVTKRQQFHNGIDLAAPGGSSILAAYEGDVVAAGYSATMGNYIMIDHGSGIYTIYMHASALYVSKGQTVSKGQKIAAVGSTGRSTGNHLHFSVRQNGNYVSPWNYLK